MFNNKKINNGPFGFTISKEEEYQMKTADIYKEECYENGRRVANKLTQIIIDNKEEYRVCAENPRYAISNYGHFYDRATGRIIEPTSKDPANNGYGVNYLDGVGLRYNHRLVAQAFCSDLDEKCPILDKHENKKEVPRYEAEIRRICELLVDGSLSNLEIAKKVAAEFNSDKISEGYIRIIKYCNPKYQPELWPIVKDYKDKFVSKIIRNYTEEEIDLMCKGLNDKMSAKDISLMVCVEDNEIFRRTLSQLRGGYIYKNIVDKYPNIGKQYSDALTEDQAEQILLLSADGLNSHQIADKMGLEFNYSFRSKVNLIRKGKSFPQVYEKYKDKINIPSSTLFNKDQIHEICKMMNDGKSTEYIADTMGSDINKMKNLVSNIRQKRVHKEISDQYPNIVKTSKYKYDDETAEKIYLLYTEKGMRPTDIAKELGLVETPNFRNLVGRIVNGLSNPNVWKKYNTSAQQ